MTLSLTLYRALTGLAEPLAPRLLDARVRRGKEDAARVDERLGVAGRPRPEGPLAWLHAVSVGESLSLLPLIERIRTERPDVVVLVTTGTVTAARIVAERAPPGVIHHFAPVDGPRAVAAFLDHWRPDVGVLVESELWPNLILAAERRGVRLALVSARITEGTARGWARAPGAARRLLQTFELILPQDRGSADRLAELGARIDGLGNLKLSGGPLPYDASAFSRLSAQIGDRPVVVAISTHEGEEVAVARAVDRLAGTEEDRPLLIVVPRHPERGEAVAEALSAQQGPGGRRVTRRSPGQPIAGADVHVADTLGETGLMLRLADVVVMGGSFGPSLGLPPVGGHNPLEPARLGKPAITGPDAGNWAAVTTALLEAGGLARVGRAEDLTPVIAALLADPTAAREMGERARRAAADAGAGLDRLWTLLAPLMPPPAAPGARPAGRRRA